MTRPQTKADFHTSCAYQPIFDTSGGVFKYEALAREIDYRKSKIKLLLPADMIDRLSEKGHVDNLDVNSLHNVCRFLHDKPDVVVNINLSAQLLARPDCVKIISDVLKEYGIESDQLGLEILEHDFGENEKQILDNVFGLALAGHAISVDDYGEGHSNLERVEKVHALLENTGQRLTVKIDRSLTEQAAKNGNFSFLDNEIFQDVNLVFEGATKPFQDKLMATEFYKRYVYKDNIGFQGHKMGLPNSSLDVVTEAALEEKSTPELWQEPQKPGFNLGDPAFA